MGDARVLKPLSVAGTFNDWDLSDSRSLALEVADHRLEVRCHLAAGRHAFKWVWDHDWNQWWGCRGNEPLVTPTWGMAVPGGDEVVLNVLLDGEFCISLDAETRRWSVVREVEGPLLEGAFWPDLLLADSRFRSMFEGLREHGQTRAFGYDWNYWERLAPFLEHGSFRGFFPIRQGNQVLFVHNGVLREPLFAAGTWNDWSVGPDRFFEVAGTDVRLLYREFEPGARHAYKLHHDGHWFQDPLNRWVQPDGMPIPMFRPGHFNSVLDLAGPPCMRGDALLWIRDFPSVIRDNRRDIFVLLPREYAARPDHRYPVLYVQDGNEAVTRAQMHRVALEAFDAGFAQPCIVVFIALAAQSQRGYEYGDLEGRIQYADFLSRELVPFIDRQFRTISDPEGRGVVGASFGGLISFYIGWRHSDLFGKVGGQGTSFWVNDWDILRLFLESPRRRLFFYMDSAAPSHAKAPRDNHLGTRYAERILRGVGYPVRHVQRKDQRHDWPYWRERFGEVLRTFWPPSRG